MQSRDSLATAHKRGVWSFFGGKIYRLDSGVSFQLPF